MTGRASATWIPWRRAARRAGLPTRARNTRANAALVCVDSPHTRPNASCHFSLAHVSCGPWIGASSENKNCVRRRPWRARRSARFLLCSPSSAFWGFTHARFQTSTSRQTGARISLASTALGRSEIAPVQPPGATTPGRCLRLILRKAPPKSQRAVDRRGSPPQGAAAAADGT